MTPTWRGLDVFCAQQLVHTGIASIYMIVRKLRLQRGWSQEHLAALSGLSVRTIQRIERGARPGLDSINALAAVFEVELPLIQEGTQMNKPGIDEQALTAEEQQALEYVRDVKGFYSHLVTFIVVMILLFLVNLMTSPDFLWATWTLIGWGIGVFAHGVSVFEVFNMLDSNWEKRAVEKRLGRKL